MHWILDFVIRPMNHFSDSLSFLGAGNQNNKMRRRADNRMCQCYPVFIVEDLAGALESANVIVEPFEATETLRVAFIKDNEAVIELMERI